MVCLCAVDHLTNYWNVACRVACAGTAAENELPVAGSDPLRRVDSIAADVSNSLVSDLCSWRVLFPSQSDEPNSL